MHLIVDLIMSFNCFASRVAGIVICPFDVVAVVMIYLLLLSLFKASCHELGGRGNEFNRALVLHK